MYRYQTIGVNGKRHDEMNVNLREYRYSPFVYSIFTIKYLMLVYRIDPYRFGYSTDKLGRGFGYSCKDVFECQDLKNREDAAREAQRRSYGPPAPLYNQPYHPSPAPYQPSSATYRVPYENANLCEFSNTNNAAVDISDLSLL